MEAKYFSMSARASRPSKSPTIYDVAHNAGLSTAGIIWPVTRNARTLDWTVPDMRSDEEWAKYGTQSWLAELRPSGNAGRHSDPLIIRVIDYQIDDGRPNEETYRLFTTIVDPGEASAVELAAAMAATPKARQARKMRKPRTPARISRPAKRRESGINGPAPRPCAPGDDAGLYPFDDRASKKGL